MSFCHIVYPCHSLASVETLLDEVESLFVLNFKLHFSFPLPAFQPFVFTYGARDLTNWPVTSNKTLALTMDSLQTVGESCS